MALLSFNQFINESLLSPANLKEFIEYNTFQPTDVTDMDEESVDIFKEIDQTVLDYLGSNPEGVIQLETVWRHKHENADNLVENSEWMKMGNFPELFYQKTDPDAKVSDMGFTFNRSGIVREEYLYGAGPVIGDEIDWPLYLFRWRGHNMCLLRSLEDTMEWLFMRKQDFAQETIG